MPDVPYMPLRLDCEEKDFLDSLEGKINHILIVRKEEKSLSVLGYTGGSMRFVHYEPYVEERDVKEYVRIDWHRGTGEVNEAREEGVYYLTNKELLLSACTLNMYSIVRLLLPQQREREEKQTLFYATALEYLRRNKAELEREVKQIPIYEGSLVDLERRLGRVLDFMDTGKPEQFLKAKDTFWLRVEAARLGADMVIQYTPGSAIGTPVRFRERL